MGKMTFHTNIKGGYIDYARTKPTNNTGAGEPLTLPTLTETAEHVKEAPKANYGAGAALELPRLACPR
jgi:hypothetical protein